MNYFVSYHIKFHDDLEGYGDNIIKTENKLDITIIKAFSKKLKNLHQRKENRQVLKLTFLSFTPLVTSNIYYVSFCIDFRNGTIQRGGKLTSKITEEITYEFLNKYRNEIKKTIPKEVLQLIFLNFTPL